MIDISYHTFLNVMFWCWWFNDRQDIQPVKCSPAMCSKHMILTRTHHVPALS